MAKRLTMTNADYLAIAVSPALIMALVGSLVFFLIEVLYVGQYQGRMNYAFALFVFAAVLIARISIEMGSDHAALFALPLGIVMFLFLLRFVEQPNPLGHVINLALLGLVWWCAHQLTWDSTVIDDDDDASGEGLMQRIGVDTRGGAGGKTDDAATAGAKENELFAAAGSANSKLVPWWQQPLQKKSGPHTPGLWVLYFSLAALPLFGIGQHWIPPAETGRRRYVFVLLLVYVAAALALLVTTSFLNLRRYLRQRRVEMPLPITGTWVGVGALSIVAVMLFAALIPRPGAEIALSRAPWESNSSDNLSASKVSVIRDGGGKKTPDTSANNNATAHDGQEKGENEPLEQGDDPSSARDDSAGARDGSSATSPGDKSDSAVDEGGESSGKDRTNQASGAGKSNSDQPQTQDADQANNQPNSNANESSTENEPTTSDRAPSSPQSGPAETFQKLSHAVGEITGLLKMLFYGVLALLLCFFAWTYRQQILQALADILSQLAALFGRKTARAAESDEDAASPKARPASFHDFHDPFLTGQHSQMQPEELVRYSFAAFEAWANDRGRARTPDCTPRELVTLTLDPQSPMYEDARQLVRLYSELAYAARSVTPESAGELQTIWQMMRSTHSLDQQPYG
jgi:hypothetical protein